MMPIWRWLRQRARRRAAAAARRQADAELARCQRREARLRLADAHALGERIDRVERSLAELDRDGFVADLEATFAPRRRPR